VQAAGLEKLVEFNTKREVESKLTELQETIKGMILADPPATEAEVVAVAKAKKAEFSLPDADILKVGWAALVTSINMTGKNQQQIVQAVAKQIKTYKELLAGFATNGKLELSLLVIIQVCAPALHGMGYAEQPIANRILCCSYFC
jgi:hypothetical protein